MSLTPGTRLGPYEIVALLGAGGMGEVYRARDTRLDRTVAIKVLPPAFAADKQFRERFDREARAISALDHPHICALYDVGDTGGTAFLVMQYLEGETLERRLQRGALPLNEALQTAIGIASALDAAHRAGIVHRDLKPGNVMVTKGGAKLLDFGLAKATAPVAGAGLSMLPTTPPSLTAQGAILGTFQYMAPEQLEGQDADARTDIFAFGALLYEMLTGKKAFEGKSQASLIAAILEREPPPISTLQPLSPSVLDWLVKKCLAKERGERWQGAKDLTDELKWIAEGSFGTGRVAAPEVKAAAKSWRRMTALGLTVLAAAAITGLGVWNFKPTPPRTVSRLVISLPSAQQLAGLDNGPAVALSPDGRHVAYVATQAGTQQLYLRAMDSLEARPVSGTEGATEPFFSPDGQWLGFFAAGKLKKVSLGGGAPLALAAAANPRGAFWDSHGTIVFAPTDASVLEQVSDGGGTPQPLIPFEKGEVSQRWPEFLPGGKAVLFAVSPTSGANFNDARIVVQSLGPNERRGSVLGGLSPRYAPSGHLVYAQGGNLMAVPFDPQRLSVTATAVLVVEGVLQSSATGAAQYSFSATGSLAYVPGGAQSAARSRLVWVTRNGTEEPLAAPAHAYFVPRMSPDGRRVAVGISEEESQIWLYDLSRETLSRLTFEGNANNFPGWTPDGKRIAFQSNKEGPANVFWQAADGSGRMDRLATSEYPQGAASWSGDGQLLAFYELNPTTQRDIWVLRLADRKAQPFLRTQSDEAAPQFSPDGGWLAYVSNESGRYEAYVQSYPGPGGKWQISTEGGTEPMWNRNGRELFYRSGDKMMAVDIATQPVFTVGKPRMLFEGRYLPAAFPIANYDVSLDGQRFLMLKPSEQGAVPTQINVVLNWFTELQQRVPTR